MHYVHWEQHNGLKNRKAFPTSTSRAKVESFRRKKGSDPSVKSAWIVWGSLPKK